MINDFECSAFSCDVFLQCGITPLTLKVFFFSFFKLDPIISLTWSPLQQQPTMEWQGEKTSLWIMLHCFWAHACLYGLAVQGLVML